MVAEEVFVNCSNFNPVIRNRSHNSYLRLRGAGAEMNIFGSATLMVGTDSHNTDADSPGSGT
jgi:hypothetical protein